MADFQAVRKDFPLETAAFLRFLAAGPKAELISLRTSAPGVAPLAADMIDRLAEIGLTGFSDFEEFTARLDEAGFDDSDLKALVQPFRTPADGPFGDATSDELQEAMLRLLNGPDAGDIVSRELGRVGDRTAARLLDARAAAGGRFASIEAAVAPLLPFANVLLDAAAAELAIDRAARDEAEGREDLPVPEVPTDLPQVPEEELVPSEEAPDGRGPVFILSDLHIGSNAVYRVKDDTGAVIYTVRKSLSNGFKESDFRRFIQWLRWASRVAQAVAPGQPWDIVVNGDFLDVWQADIPEGVPGQLDTYHERLEAIVRTNITFFGINILDTPRGSGDN